MKRQSVILVSDCLLRDFAVCVAPFGGPHAQAQNPAAQNNSGAGTAPVSGEASAKHAAQEPKSAGQRPAGQKLAEEQFKNIQALKGIPADQLIPAMQFITASLGVDCEFCHVHDKMDSDDKKPKKIARQMITMMFDIDKNNFDGRLEVTCYTCHRGAAKPVSIPVIKDEEIAGPGAPGKKPVENARVAEARRVAGQISCGGWRSRGGRENYQPRTKGKADGVWRAKFPGGGVFESSGQARFRDASARRRQRDRV